MPENPGLRPTPLTEQELEELEGALRAATGQLPSCAWEALPPEPHGESHWTIDAGNMPIATIHMGIGEAADAKLIAALRNAAPSLISEVRRLRAALEAILFASDQCRGHRDCGHSMEPWRVARELLGLAAEPARGASEPALK